MRLNRFSFLLLVLIASYFKSTAQVYPVRADIQIKAPYSLFLSDYALPGSEKMKINLRLLQSNRPSYAVGLRFTIEGSGITISSSANGVYEPVYLAGGETISLSGSDLETYFKPENLVFTGFDKTQYLKTHKLPEGIYQIIVEAVDFTHYSKSLVVSNKAMTTAWFMLNDPPKFNLPQSGEVVRATFPQAIFIQWLPQHINSPNGTLDTEYDFTMVEINPGQNVESRTEIDLQVANQAIQSQIPFYETTTTSTSLTYDSKLPQLIPGKFYAVRVRAKEKYGLDLFKNNGFSEVSWFRFGEPCKPPSNLRGDVPNFRKAELSWDAENTHTEFAIFYRPVGGTDWYEQESLINSTTLTDLQPSSDYEYQVRGFCGSVESEPSVIFPFRTPQDAQTGREVRCGEADSTATIDRSSPLTSASVGDTWKVGKFNLVLTAVSGERGSFSGKGEILVPFLATTIKTEFSGVQVNSARQVYEGEIKAFSSGYTLIEQSVIDELVKKEQEELQKDSKLCIKTEDNVESDVPQPGEPVILLGEFVISIGDTILVNGKTVVVDKDTQFMPNDVVTLPKYKDKGGNDIVVDKKEKVEKGRSTYSVKQGPLAGKGSLGYLEKELDDLIKSILKEQRKQNEDTVDRYKRLVKLTSESIIVFLEKSKLPVSLVGGVVSKDGKSDHPLLWEGMSERITIVKRNNLPDNTISQVYDKHYALYVQDTTLQYGKVKDNVLESYLEKEKLNQLKNEILAELKNIDQGLLDHYQEGETGYNDFQVLLKGKVADKIEKSVKLLRTPIETSGLWHPGFYETALALNVSDPVDFLKYLVEDEATSEPQAISSAVRAELLSRIITENNRQVYMMSPTKATDLPIGITQDVGGKEWIVAIENMTFTPSGAYFDAFMSIEVPFTESVKLPFGIDKIRFTPYGISGVSSVKLMLLKDVLIPINADVQLILKGTGGNTFAEIDCNGFKSLGLEGEFEFCENLIVPDGIGGKPGEGRVKASFATSLHDWSEFLTEIDITPFQVKSLPGWGFTVSNAIIDFSDISNGAAMKFPDGYQSTAFVGDDKNLWKGFYLREASVKLPPEFTKKARASRPSQENGAPSKADSLSRITIAANDLMIEIGNTSFSGTLAVKNALPLTDGDLSGWGYSIDSIKVSVVNNQLRSGQLVGRIDMPMIKATASNATSGEPVADLKFSAMIEGGEKYVFAVEPLQNLSIPMWGAGKLDLLPSSSMQLALIDGKFLPKAVLNGKMTIGVGLSGNQATANENTQSAESKFAIGSVSFEGLTLQTVAPFVSASAFSLGLGNENKLGNFPISINQIGIRKLSDQQSNQVGLGFNVVVNLVGEGDGGFGAECGITIIAENNNGWKFKGIDISKIAVNIDGGAYKMAGQLDFFKQDPTFGKGFKGQVQATFTPGFTLNVAALFGEVDGLRYWYADGKLAIDAGMPFMTGMAFYGFGGGAYYHMRMAGLNDANLSDIGKTPSGIVYLPDRNTHLGIKASVIIGTHPTNAAFNGDVTLEVAFNSKGGVNTIALSGNGYFVTPPAPGLEAISKMVKSVAEHTGNAALANSSSTPVAPERPGAQVYAKLLIKYDFPNETLHGNLKIYANIAGGAVTGRLANNLAGEAVVHFDPSDWYIHVGKPEERIGLKALGLFDLSAYMMTGTSVPDMPAPPAHVSEILEGEFDSMRDMRLLSKGGGFVFGADVIFDTGDLTFLMFYGRFLMGQGFDIMFKSYGTDAYCAGRPGPLGINGWYAAGQAYAYMDGRIGIKVDLPFYSGKYEILRIGGAAVFQAQLPNPIWMKGIAGGRYSILNGAVKGYCDFEIEVGEKCKIVAPGGVLAGLKVISQITPAPTESNVSVFNAAQAVFNMPVNTEFSLMDLDGIEKKFRIKLEYFKVLDGNTEIPGTLRWDDDNLVLAFDSYDILPPKKSLKAMAKVSFEENIRGGWQPVRISGNLATETMESTFTTGDAPDFIPENNIQYSYPVMKQRHFHKDEHNQGYIKLKKGQPYLFNPGAEWRQVVRFKLGNGSSLEQDLTYSGQQVTFFLPVGLENATIYRWEIVNIPANEPVALDENVYASANTVESSGVDMTITTQQAEGALNILQEKAIFSSYFRTSQFGTFAAKINSMQAGDHWARPIRIGVLELGQNFTSQEYFDKAEIGAANGQSPLVVVEADLANTPWYTTRLYPLFYRDYQSNGFSIDWRPADQMGIPPYKAVKIKQADLRELSEEEVSNNVADALTTPLIYPAYELAHYVLLDHDEILQKAANHSLRGSNSWIDNILLQNRPYMLFPSDYPIKVKYILPGSGEITYQKTIVLRRN